MPGTVVVVCDFGEDCKVLVSVVACSLEDVCIEDRVD